MPRVKPKALSAPPSQEALEDGADSTSLFTSNTVAALFLRQLTIYDGTSACTALSRGPWIGLRR
jgi:hypothetical protein